MKKKCKLAIVISHVIQYLCPFYREIAKHPDIELKVYFCSDHGYKKYFDKGFGKEVSWDNNLLNGFNFEFLKNISFSPNPSTFWGCINPDIINKLRSEKFDAVIINGWNTFTNHLVLLSGIPVFLRCETNLLPKINPAKLALKKFILSFYFKFIKSFLAIGRLNKEFFLDCGVLENKIFYVPYVVDNNFFISNYKSLNEKKADLRKKYNIKNDIPLILFSGKLIDVKNPFDLLKAYEIVSKEFECGLVYMGDGVLRKGLEEYVNRKNLKNVYFLGFKNQLELPEIFSMADVFVLPSSFEPWGLVVNEAMCFSLPIITSNQVGASSDLVIENENGYIFPAGNVQALTESLKKLISNSKLREQFGKKSFEIISIWSYKEGVEGIYKALESI